MWAQRSPIHVDVRSRPGVWRGRFVQIRCSGRQIQSRGRGASDGDGEARRFHRHCAVSRDRSRESRLPARPASLSFERVVRNPPGVASRTAGRCARQTAVRSSGGSEELFVAADKLTGICNPRCASHDSDSGLAEPSQLDLPDLLKGIRRQPLCAFGDFNLRPVRRILNDRIEEDLGFL